MRAFAIDDFGQPGSVREMPVPEPGPGEVRVRVVGATGGVGGFATQLLVHRGVRVIASVRPENAEYARSLGAAETVDYTAGDLVAQVREAHPAGIDGIADFASDEATLTNLAGLVR